MTTLPTMTRILCAVVLICGLTGCISTIKGVRESDSLLSQQVPGSYQAIAKCLLETYENRDFAAFVRLIDSTEVKQATVTASILPIFIWPQPSFLFEATVSQQSADVTTIQLKTGWFAYGREAVARNAIESCTMNHKAPHATP